MANLTDSHGAPIGTYWVADHNMWLIYILKGFLGIVAIIGCFGSLMNIVVVVKNKKFRTIPNSYVVNLAVADLIVCCFLIPMTLVTYTVNLDQLLCQLIGYPNLMCLMVSVMNLSLVAINRYVMICRSRDTYLKIYTKRNTGISLAATWILAALLYAVPFMGYGTYARNELFGTCIFQSRDRDTWIFVLIFADSIVFFPSVGATLFCYTSILLKFRESRKKVNAMKVQTTATVTAKDTTTTEVSVIGEGGKKDDKKPVVKKKAAPKKPQSESDKKMMALVKNLVTIFCTFVGCWFPLIAAYKIDYYGTWPAEIYHVLFAIAQSNSAWNFIIYVSMNAQFRNGYLQVLTCGKYGKDNV